MSRLKKFVMKHPLVEYTIDYWPEFAFIGLAIIVGTAEKLQ